MADSQHTTRRAPKGAPIPSRRTLIAGTSTVVAAPAFSWSSAVARSSDDTIVLCHRWIALEAEVDRLWDEWSELESKLADKHASFFRLSEAEQHQLPGGGLRMLEIKQTAARLTPLREELLRKVTRQKAHTPEAVVAKLVVASRRMVPEHEPEAYRIVRDTIKDLRRLHQLKA